MREGDWKLHLPRSVKDQPFWSKNSKHSAKGFITLKKPRLCNLSADLAEKKNCAAEHPEVFARLQLLAKEARKELGDVHVQGADQREINLVNPQQR